MALGRDSGDQWQRPLAYYDRDTSSWKTSLSSSEEDLTVSSGIWPKSGMTLAGIAYELPTSEHRIAGRGSFLLLKTPTSQLAINGGSQHPAKRKAGGHGPTLADEVEHLLPTTTASDAKASGGNNTSDMTLTDAVVRTQLGATTNPRFADGKRF